MTDLAADIHVILDTTAIRAFLDGDIAIGELILEVTDSGGHKWASPRCAWPTVADTDFARDHLRLLADHHATTITPATTDWQALAAAHAITGRLDAAVAVLTAIDTDALVLTAQPGVYAGLAGDRILPIDPE